MWWAGKGATCGGWGRCYMWWVGQVLHVVGGVGAHQVSVASDLKCCY